MEAEGASSEFNWVKKARASSTEHKERRSAGISDAASPPRTRPPRSPSSSSPPKPQPSIPQALPPGVQRPVRPPRPTLSAQQQSAPTSPPKISSPKDSAPSSSSRTIEPAPPSKPTPTRAPSPPSPPSPPTIPASTIASRKSSLMERMTSKPTSSGPPSSSSSNPPSPSSPAKADSGLNISLEKLPDVPLDLGALDADEQDIREMLQSLFVDDLTEGGGGSVASPSTTFGREAKAQEEFKAWVEQMNAVRPISAGVDKDDDGQLPDISYFIKEAADELEGFSRLAAQISAEDEDANDLSNDAEEIEGGSDDAEVDEKEMLARLKATDPDLYELIMSAPASKEDEDMLKLLSSINGGAGMDDDEEEQIDDEEIAKILKEEGLNPDQGGLWGGDEGDDDVDDDEEEGSGLEEIVEEIENDSDLSEEERARATFGIASIFNTAAEEASSSPSDARKKKGADVESYDPTLRGQTTTGRVKGGSGEGKDKDDSPPPLLSRPKMT